MTAMILEALIDHSERIITGFALISLKLRRQFQGILLNHLPIDHPQKPGDGFLARSTIL